MTRRQVATFVRHRRDDNFPPERLVIVRMPPGRFSRGGGIGRCWFTWPQPLPGVHGLRCAECGRRERGRARHYPECPLRR